MKAALGFLTVSTLTVGALLAVSGCEASACDDAQPLEESDGGESPDDPGGSGSEETTDSENCVQLESLTLFEGTEFSQFIEWRSGGTIFVDSVNGRVDITQGPACDGANPDDSCQVEVIFKPYSYRAHSKKDEAIEEMENNLVVTHEGDGSGGAIIKTARNGGTTGLGARIEVKIPTGFNGKLEIEQNAGSVDVDYSAQATELVIRHDDNSVGDCEVTGSPTITSTDIRCDGEITVNNVSDDVTVISTDKFADVSVAIAGVSATASGGTIEAQGSIALFMPMAGDYVVQAQASNEGVVNEGSLPASCTVAEAAVNSKTVSCGAGGPTYTVKADVGAATFEHNVDISYR